MANNETFLFSDYWPQPSLGTLVIMEYSVKGLQYSSIIGYENESIWYQYNYIDNKWTETLVYNYHYIDTTGKDIGIKEIENQSIVTSFLQKIFMNIKRTKFCKAYEIRWGGLQKIGDIIDSQIKIDTFKSSFPIWPLSSRQVVKFVGCYDSLTLVDQSETYNDIIEITYDKILASKTIGARYWYAKGIGIIQMQQRINFVETGDMIPVRISIVKGHINKERYPVLG